jgi:t-SNARE complex subunit (syntaxin)
MNSQFNGASQNLESVFWQSKNRSKSYSKKHKKKLLSNSSVQLSGLSMDSNLLMEDSTNDNFSALGVDLPLQAEFYYQFKDCFLQFSKNLVEIKLLKQRKKKDAFGFNKSLENRLKKYFEKSDELSNDMLKFIRRVERQPLHSGLMRKFADGVLQKMKRDYLGVQTDYKNLKWEKPGKEGQGLFHSTSSFDFIINNEDQSCVYSSSGEKIVMKEISAKEDDRQLLMISSSLQSLTGMLTEMSQQVLLQGEVIDRIDENTQVTLQMTRKANKVLHETKQMMENSCASKLQRLLFLINIMLFVGILVKFYYLQD